MFYGCELYADQLRSNEDYTELKPVFSICLANGIHAHKYEPPALLNLFPETATQLAKQTILKISEITEDKTMYDAREKAIRDQQWSLNAAHREGEIRGEIKLILTLERILGQPLSNEAVYKSRTLKSFIS